MKYLWSLLALVALPVFATNLQLSWVAPSAYTDGTTIPSGTVIQYNVYGGPCGGVLKLLTPTPITGTTNVRTNVNTGTLGYAVSAIIAGVESAQTTPVCATVLPTPSPPGSLTVTPVTTSTIAYTIVPGSDTYSPLIVGTVALGVPCNPNERLLHLNVIPRAAVTFTEPVKPIAVLGSCI